MDTLHQFQYSRTSTLIALTNIDKDLWDVHPSGYPNTIRWNAGHIYVTAEEFLNKADNNYKITHPEWIQFFIDGTHPDHWNNEVPILEDIMTALKEQDERITNYFSGKLRNDASETVTLHALSIDTVDASLQFVTWHEGIHLGIMKSLKLAIAERTRA
ncbi:DinB family protein [bacterium LRH843]|nr:DinB family protein [bacterium LRH843]